MSDSDVMIKRLHVSGLTPQISATDLKARFASFGNVKALDGLGKLDALGQPRPFAYVTLETTKPQLAKCLNLLSGTTWKGAKLRIGEAKPDFRERIRKENEACNADGRPTKRRRLARGTQGIHTEDMSLVTPASPRPGWRVTPLGRLVRPMYMRPLHPLPTHPSLMSTTEKKLRRRKSGVPVRTRRRRIDPEEWGSTYLSGIMLEGSSGSMVPEREMETRNIESQSIARRTEIASGNIDAGTVDLQANRIERARVEDESSSNDVVFPCSIPTASSPSQLSSEGSRRHPEAGLAGETARSLVLLNSLFGSARMGDDNQDDDGGGEESLSDVETGDNAETLQAAAGMYGENDRIEYVPHNTSAKVAKESAQDQPSRDAIALATDSIGDVGSSDMHRNQTPKPQAGVQSIKLKDIFAPRPEETGFSIINNLDLDLELDEDLPPMSAPSLPVEPREPAPPAARIMSSTTKSTITFDPKRPFFFPHALLFPGGSSLEIKPGDPRDIFSQEPDFYRTETDEEIRQKWEERKVELTREWKRRHREAIKSTRRRGGVRD